MVRGITDIITWFENTGMPYWRIYPHKNIQSGNFIMKSNQDEGRSHGDARQELSHKLKVLNRGTFTIAAYDQPDRLPTKGYQYTDCEITQADAQVQPAAVSGPPALAEADIQKRIDDAVDNAIGKYKTEQELADLKKKNAELEKQVKELEKSTSEPWNKVIGAIAPYSDKIIAGIFPAAQVAGFPPPDPGPEDNDVQDAEVIESETTQLTPAQQDILSDFVTTLAANDTDWENTLKRLTKKINETPSMITMVKNFI
jgi:hypothetical protein